ncbi:flavin monoamine oxidase family protein [Frankia sp. Cr1]|uniref:flavin monoamine oxidase family protein n=1 Tax=Frankia sp. Cr1 TaxID=3073931 RepID=UPI002AD3FB77|nr:flavin monoamine oxidase family protein [Frankia sp. Cr1]
MVSSQDVVDVIVVGGGYSGLSAAWALNGQGHSVTVLEARDRVGGRAWTQQIPGGGWVDNGGQWIGPGQTRILTLAEEMGVTTFPTFQDGRHILVYDGVRTVYAAESSGSLEIPVPTEDLADFMNAVAVIDALSREVPSEAPWEASRATEWDTQTVATWMEQNLKTAGAKFALHSVIVGYFSVEPCDLSFLHLLFYVAAAGGVEDLEASSLVWRFLGGAQEIPVRLAERLGGKIRYESPVRTIDQTGDTAIVETDHGHYEGRYVIVAASPALAARIRYDPPMPASRDQYTQRMPLGSVIKCHAVYPYAFWRDDNLNGQVVSEDDINSIFDNSPPDGVPGILVGFIEGEVARRWLDRSEEDVRQKMLDCFVVHFGERARTPQHFYYANWGREPWSRGCYCGVPTPGTWTNYRDALRRPVGRIHWAGTETSTKWAQYMEGAVRSGQRAAAEVHEELSK